MKITIPEYSLITLVGTSGSGKSSFARKHFKPTEVISSDHCRALVSDDENDLKATKDAFEVLHFIARKRLKAGKVTVIDATNVQMEARKPIVALSREYHCLPVAIVLDLPERICQDRNRGRPDRDFGPHVIRQQSTQLRRSLRNLKREGFRNIHILKSPEEVEAATIEYSKMWNNKKDDHGPFDIIGDIHGCYDELQRLLDDLGYQANGGPPRHPSGRKAVFLGDLVDRGPKTPEVLRLVMGMVESGAALCVPGNHDIKLVKKLRGKDVRITHGLAESLQQLEKEPPEFKTKVADFLHRLISHYVLDDGNLVVAHAGMREEMQGRGSGKVRSFALFGETTGETDEYGLPVRYDWASEYRGKAAVVYGHTPVGKPQWLNNTVNVDTGCVFGGTLTALQYPEKQFVSVKAAQIYYEPAKPLAASEGPSPLSAQQEHDDVLDIEDVLGKRIISTALRGNVTVREENGLAALEVMSRFATNPKWLVYLPPTMSPCETSKEEGLLEHPAEAFSHFRSQGIPKVVCQEKHMGSRAIVIVCKSTEAARRRFGVVDGGRGICYTRTGRRFFHDDELERQFLDAVHAAISKADLWEALDTDWFILDCELMPWSAKAQELIRQQYAAVGAASRMALDDAISSLELAKGRLDEAADLHARYSTRRESCGLYAKAYKGYCWPVNSLADFKLAPFHILATEGAVHTDKDHLWHMERLHSLVDSGSGLFQATRYKVIDVTDEGSITEGVDWWRELTGNGGEGMVVKPMNFISKGRKGLVQPAVKCRGKEYLRIIYGPEYTLPDHLTRLKGRGLSHKRSMALREFALGIEALDRFVRKEPLRRVHECVFGVLALESEPVDPRL